MTALTSHFHRHEDMCANSHRYPLTLLRNKQPHELYIFQKHAKYLAHPHNECLHFNQDSGKHLIEFLEVDAENPFNLDSISFSDSNAQLQHMQETKVQWDIRYVFMETNDSKSPLNCSSDMLKSCFTFHQVEPSFLESIYTFGRHEKPLDLCLAHFKSSHTIGLDKKSLTTIPELRRSGLQLQTSYLLRSVEYNASSLRTWKWHLQPKAVYHSFDAETGQSFWFNVATDDKFKRRLRDSATVLDWGDPEMMREHRVYHLFTAALSTHLIYLYWCDENWRQCINEMEHTISKILERARMASIEDLKLSVPEFLNRIMVKVTGQSRASGEFRTIPSTIPSFTRKSLEAGLGLVDQISMSGQPSGLRRIGVSEPQALQLWGQRIEHYSLAVQLNITVLGQITTFYSGLKDELVSLYGSMGGHYEIKIRRFVDEVADIASSLETRKTQMQSLTAQLSEGQTLYGMLLQQVTAESAENSAKKMESIAFKTAQETASMHIITIVTLIFLPGTFVATFFQSGVFWWKEAPEDMESTWSYRGDAFAFFSYLCFPLMMATLGIWFCVWFKMGKDRHKLEKKYL